MISLVIKLLIRLHVYQNNNEIPRERYISPNERQQNIDELRLI